MWVSLVVGCFVGLVGFGFELEGAVFHVEVVAEAFPEQLLNLPPMPHQTMPKPEGG